MSTDFQGLDTLRVCQTLISSLGGAPPSRVVGGAVGAAAAPVAALHRQRQSHQTGRLVQIGALEIITCRSVRALAQRAG